MGKIAQSSRFFTKQTKLIIGVAAGLVVGGASTVAVMAAVPDSSGVIHACYKSDLVSDGQLRIIDTANQSCGGDETAIAWNANSPAHFVSNLANADFSDFDLRYRNLSYADIHGASFVRTPITSAVFDYADLSGASFDQTAYGQQGQRLSRLASFKHSNLSNAQFINSIAIEDTDFSHANFSSVLVDLGSGFMNSNFSHVDFRTATFPAQPAYQGSTPLFSNSNLSDTNFSGQNLSNFQLQYNNASNANFSNIDFSNASVQGTDLSSANVTGVTWSNTTCPDQTNSDNNGGTCAGHLAL
ncbi:MAG TPA: pentapeptide repeat-containing protein [Candidatus Saccharimonadales bacterium]|nr:pentapeptide repeat-containing protein [Candidatus Saccharimonadales bacterium]